MNLSFYIEDIHRQLFLAAAAGGDEARALTQSLVAPLDAAIRLALQDVLAAAAEEITCELAPGSVDLRIRGRNPEFVVTPPPPTGDSPDGGRDPAAIGGPALATVVPPGSAEGDVGAMSRINLRLPDQLKARIERAATGAGLSVNAWLVQAAATAVDRGTEPHAPPTAQRYTGWAR